MGFECSGGQTASYIYVNLYRLASFYLVGDVELEFLELIEAVEPELVLMIAF